MRVRSLSFILISLPILLGACSRQKVPFFQGNGCFVSVEKVDTFYCQYVENFRLDSSFILSNDLIMLYAHCLDGKSIFLREGSSHIIDYVNSCIFSREKPEGMALMPFGEPQFYRFLAEAEGRRDLLYVADMLERKSYCNYFHFYYPRDVDFYRKVIRFRLALEETKEGNYNEALRILSSLSDEEDFRIRFVVNALRDTIMRRLGQNPEERRVMVNFQDDTLVREPVCEMDFPETLIVHEGELIRWNTPIIPDF